MRFGGTKSWPKTIIWAIVFYLFFFQPIVNKLIYVGIEAGLVLLLFLWKPRVFRDNIRLFRREYIFALLICSYSLLMDLANQDIVYLDRFLASFFQGYLGALLIVYCISKFTFLQEHLSDCLVLMSFIACSITISAILVPSFGQFCIEHATQDAKERLQDLYIDGGFSQYRSFGLSESLNFTYAYVLSVVGGFVLSSKFKLYTPFLLIMVFVTIIFNARIAFVPLIVSLFYLFFFKKKSVEGVISIILTFVILIVLAAIGLRAFPELNNEWGLSFFTELSDFLTGEDDGTLGTLSSSMWVIPDNVFDLLFGTGENLFISTTKNSDVGYILQLNYGGLLLLGIILSYFICIALRIYRKLTLQHWFTIMFIVSVFVLNFKGFYLAAIPGNRFLTFLYVYYIYAARKGIIDLNCRSQLIIV